MQEVVQFDFTPALVVQDKAGKFIINPKNEEHILRLQQVKEDFEQWYARILQDIADEMRHRKLTNVKGEQVTLSLTTRGLRYGLKDKDEAMKMGLAKEVVITQVRPDTKAIDALNGNIPDCIEQKDREEKLEIKVV